jgi:hypothetical protein
VKTLTDLLQTLSRHTGTRKTHIVSEGFVFRDVSSCSQSSGPAKPNFATMPTPLRSVLRDFQPRTCRTFSGEPQGHASPRPSATIAGSLAIESRRCFCTTPSPHAFSGCDGSEQFGVS